MLPYPHEVPLVSNPPPLSLIPNSSGSLCLLAKYPHRVSSSNIICSLSMKTAGIIKHCEARSSSFLRLQQLTFPTQYLFATNILFLCFLIYYLHVNIIYRVVNRYNLNKVGMFSRKQQILFDLSILFVLFGD